MAKKTRADVMLVNQGLAPTRSRAQALILAGKAYRGTARIEKAGDMMPADAELRLKVPDHPYVSRGGLKLKSALDTFAYDASAKICADFGSSTGGFTDCLLQHGATRVYAIDVGYGQLANKLCQDDRVISMERVNARHLEELPEVIELVVIDASFIGMEKLLPAVSKVCGNTADVLGMVKPQFQLGPERVPGGVVRDDADRQAAVDMVDEVAQTFGFTKRAQCDSSTHGPRGNREIFVWWRREAAE